MYKKAEFFLKFILNYINSVGDIIMLRFQNSNRSCGRENLNSPMAQLQVN